MRAKDINKSIKEMLPSVTVTLNKDDYSNIKATITNPEVESTFQFIIQAKYPISDKTSTTMDSNTKTIH